MIGQKGFSLAEMAVTVGLMGVVSLLTMRVMENQSASQLSIEASAEINSTVSIIAQTINDPKKCNSMFVGKNINSSHNELRYTVVSPPSTVNLLQTRNPPANKIYQYFYLEDGDIRLSADPKNTGMAILTLDFKVQSMAKSQKINLFSAVNSRVVRRQIPFNVVTVGSTITACGPVASRSQDEARRVACLSLAQSGLTQWNGTSCELRPQICPFGQIPINFNAAGNIVCDEARNRIQVEDLFDLNHVIECQPTAPPPAVQRVRARWGLTVSSAGKIRLTCTRF